MKKEDIWHLPFRYINENGIATQTDARFITIAEDILKTDKENDRKPQHDDVSEAKEMVDETDKLYK